METGKRITLKEIAKRAEASPMAVSVVLNGARSTARVADATRERILSVAATLNYSPNAMAQGLKRQRTNTIGVLFNWAGSYLIHSLYSAAVLDGIVGGAAEAGYHVLLYTQRWKTKAESASTFSDRRTDGIVVVAPEDSSDVIPGLVEIGLPISVVSSIPAIEGVPYVAIDNRLGVRLALDHFWNLGHRRMAYVGHRTTRHSPRERYEAYLAWMSEHELPTPDAVRFANQIPDKEEAVIEELLGREHGSRPTAILAFNDDVAVKVLDIAREKGIAVPDQLSVIGFDDILVAARSLPRLSTVRLPLFEMGAEAIKFLIARIEGGGYSGQTVPSRIIVPELIVRNSTAQAARDRR